MSWFSDNYERRIPISLDNIGGGASNSFEFAVRVDRDDFWTGVLASGNDIRLTTADGTLIDASIATALELVGFDKVNRVLTIRIEALTTLTPDAMEQAWLYYQYPGETVGPGFGVWSSPPFDTAYLPALGIRNLGPVVRTTSQRDDAERPIQRIVKSSQATKHVYWDATGELEQRDVSYNGMPYLEAIKSVRLSTKSRGAAVALADPSMVLFHGVEGGRFRTVHSGGQKDQDATVVALIETTEGQTFDRRFQLLIRDPREIL